MPQKAANSIWSKYDGIFFARGLDEEFCQMAMSDISRAMGAAGPLTGFPTSKICMRGYEELAIKVGDKITIEIKNQTAVVGFRC